VIDRIKEAPIEGLKMSRDYLRKKSNTICYSRP
jgi:hypothetical protein